MLKWTTFRAENGLTTWRNIHTRIDRELDRIIHQCAPSLIKCSSSRIAFERDKQFVIFGERTESLPVMMYSIVAVVDRRDRDGNHLALGARLCTAHSC